MNCFKKIVLFIFLSIIFQKNYAQQYHFSGGYGYSIFICNNQSLYTWGDNYYGQLARTEATCDYKTPCIATIPYSIKTIDAGLGGHCLAITTLENVVSWGNNFYGELGSGVICPTLCDRSNPEKVLGGETGNPYLEQVISVSSGQSHSYALLNTGEVVAWGNNTYGQLGDGTTIDKSSPVFVKKSNGDRLQNIVMIAAGAFHGYALSGDGYVYAWGNNQTNQLGCGNSNTQYNPQLVVDKNNIEISGITAIDAGRNFGIFLRNSSMVMGVGAFKGTDINESGTIYKTFSYAELITGGQTPNYYLENVVAISAGFSHCLAIVNEDNKNYVVAWGDNRFNDLFDNTGGQIGTGSFASTQYLSPQYVLKSTSNKLQGVTAINAGCGVSYIQSYNSSSKENEFWVCGSNQLGQLGTDDFYDRFFATRIDQKLCQPYCANISLGEDISLCIPIQETIKTGLSTIDHSFLWYKNGAILPITSDSLNIFTGGIYNVKITNTTGECPQQTSEIKIDEKEKEYHPLYTSFCNSNLEFKVVGDGTFIWYNSKNGFALDTGNVLSVSKFFTEKIIEDSIYQVWIKHVGDCQTMPFQTIKKCNCNISPPSAIDTSSCYNREYFVHATGDSIVWHTDELCLNPIFLGNSYFPLELDEGNYTFYATQIKNRCESEAIPVTLSLVYCDPWFTISGQIKTEDSISPNSKVFLYDIESSTMIDSCITNNNGLFTLFSHGNLAKIFALSPNNYYENTWAGNKLNQNDAYQFIVDATIKGVLIQLIPKVNSIQEILNETNILKAEYVEIYSLNGSKIGVCNPNIEEINALCNSKGLFIMCAFSKNNLIKSVIWQNK